MEKTEAKTEKRRVTLGCQVYVLYDVTNIEKKREIKHEAQRDLGEQQTKEEREEDDNS